MYSVFMKSLLYPGGGGQLTARAANLGDMRRAAREQVLISLRENGIEKMLKLDDQVFSIFPGHQAEKGQQR